MAKGTFWDEVVTNAVKLLPKFLGPSEGIGFVARATRESSRSGYVLAVVSVDESCELPSNPSAVLAKESGRAFVVERRAFKQARIRLTAALVTLVLGIFAHQGHVNYAADSRIFSCAPNMTVTDCGSAPSALGQTMVPVALVAATAGYGKPRTAGCFVAVV